MSYCTLLIHIILSVNLEEMGGSVSSEAPIVFLPQSHKYWIVVMINYTELTIVFLNVIFKRMRAGLEGWLSG